MNIVGIYDALYAKKTDKKDKRKAEPYVVLTANTPAWLTDLMNYET